MRVKRVDVVVVWGSFSCGLLVGRGIVCLLQCLVGSCVFGGPLLPWLLWVWLVRVVVRLLSVKMRGGGCFSLPFPINVLLGVVGGLCGWHPPNPMVGG